MRTRGKDATGSLKIVKTDTCRTVCIRARGETREQQQRARQNHEQTKRQTAPRICLKFSHGPSQDLKNHAVCNNFGWHGKTFFRFFWAVAAAASAAIIVLAGDRGRSN